MATTNILIVEDEYLTSTDIRNSLTDMGYTVPGVADNGPDAIRMAGELSPDIILMDITLKGKMTGIEAASQIREQFGIPVIYLTAHSDDVTVEKAVSSEPFGYLVKPIDERALKHTLLMALYKHAMDEKLRQSELTIRGLLNATKDQTILVDNNGRILALNEAFSRAAGKSVEALKNTLIYELIGNGTISMKMAEEIQRGNAQSPVSFEEKFRDRFLDTTIYSVSNGREGDRQLAIYRHDITALKSAEEELKIVNEKLVKEKERLAMFAAALDDMSDCAIITDSLGRIVCVNSTFEKKFALPQKTVKGKEFSDLAHADNQYPMSAEIFLHYRDTDNIAVFIAKNAYGVKMPMTLKTRPLFFENNRPKNFILVLRDKMG